MEQKIEINLYAVTSVYLFTVEGQRLIESKKDHKKGIISALVDVAQPGNHALLIIIVSKSRETYKSKNTR